MIICGVTYSFSTAAAGAVSTDVRVTVAVFACAEVLLPLEYRSFLCAPAVTETARSAITNIDFFITV